MKVRDLEWWIIGLLGISAFILAMMGFSILFTQAGVERNILDLAFQSMKIFGMEFVDEYNSPLPIQLEIARWLAPLVLLYAAAKTIIHFVRREFKSLLIKYYNDHIIITALNDKSRFLINDLLANNEKVIIVAPIDSPQKYDLVERDGAIIIDGNITDNKFLKNIAAHKAKYIIFLEDEDEKNISSAISTYQYLAKFGKDKKQSLFVHVANDLKLNELKELNFFEEFTEKNMHNSNCEFRIFSSNERASRILFNRYSPDIFKKTISNTDEQIHIALIGSGNLAQSMIIRFARLGHFANLKKLKITLFHEGANFVTKLSQNFKNINNLVEFVTIDEDLDLFDVDKFEDLHKEHEFAAVYILCEDDSLSSSMLNKISKVETDININVILTLVNPDGILSKWYSAAQIDSITLHKFNLIEESFTKEALVSEKLDELAKIIHLDYLSGIKELNPNKTSHQAWDFLPIDFKNQNREQADHVFVKLRALGFEMGRPLTFKNISSEQLEQLSEMEHNRWCAHMVLSGWTLGEVRNDQRKKHTDLIPYSQLSEPVKQYDRNAILNIPKLLELFEGKNG